MRFLTDSADCASVKKSAVGGLIDVASTIGIAGHYKDFGFTLGKNRIAEKPIWRRPLPVHAAA